MPSPKKTTSLHDWRKGTLAGFTVMLQEKIAQRDQLNGEIEELLAMMKGMSDVKLKRSYSKKAEAAGEVNAAGRRKPTGDKAIPWQKRPGNEAKVKAWQKKMQAAQKAKRKARG